MLKESPIYHAIKILQMSNNKQLPSLQCILIIIDGYVMIKQTK